MRFVVVIALALCLVTVVAIAPTASAKEDKQCFGFMPCEGPVGTVLHRVEEMVDADGLCKPYC